MNDLAQHFGLDFLAASWLPQVLTVIGAVVALNVVAHYLLRHIEKLAARSAAVTLADLLVNAMSSFADTFTDTEGVNDIVKSGLGKTILKVLGIAALGSLGFLGKLFKRNKTA